MLYDLEGEDLRQVKIRKGGHYQATLRILRGMALAGEYLLGNQMTVIRAGEDSTQMEIRNGSHGPKDIIESKRILGGVALEESYLLGNGQNMMIVMRAGDDSSWVSI